MTEYEIKMKAIEEAAFDLLKLSSAYSGEIGTVLYGIAADVGDRMRSARQQVKAVIEAMRHEYLKPSPTEPV